MSFDSIDDISQEDLYGLVGTAPERKRREYKRDLPGAGSDARKEFVADVSALANTEGGDMFYGIDEDRASGLASAINGVPKVDAEKQLSILENVLRDCLRPRIRYVMHTVPVSDERVVLIIRVLESHLKPHQSTLDYRFYARNTNGKYRLEVTEIADIITRREALPLRMRQFRKERLNLIRSVPEDLPSRVESNARFILHYMAEETFGRFDSIDMWTLANPANHHKVVQIPPVTQVQGISHRPNIDGFMFMTGLADSEWQWYAQVFQDGTVEFVNGITFRDGHGNEQFHPVWVEDDLFQSFKFVRELYALLAIGGRVTVFTSAVGVKDYIMNLGPRYIIQRLDATGHSNSIGRDPALFNEVTVDNMQVNEQAGLRPIVDQIYRACGRPQALSYDGAGEYIGYRE